MENVKETEPSLDSIINGLPDDIALFCLARVSRRYHHILRRVSKRWRALVGSDAWHLYRQKNKLDEAWIYALCRDSEKKPCFYVLDTEKRCWRPFQGVLPQCLNRMGFACEALDKRLFLLGGCSFSEDVSDEVYCFNASTDTWEDLASLSTARAYCVCQALDQKLYVVGGIGSDSNMCSWDTYDPNSKSWTSHMNPIIFPEVEQSIVLDGKLYTLRSEQGYGSHAIHLRRGTSCNRSKPEVAVYDPSVDVWQRIDNEMVSGWIGPAVVVDGTLYVLDQIPGTKLMLWHAENMEWVVVGRLSTLLTRPPCHLVAIGRSIYVIGMGLSTVVIDLDMAASVDGLMVCNSIPRLDCDCDVISCKSIAI